MPKDNLKRNSKFKLNPAMKMVTNASGIPDYAAKFAKKNAQGMEDLKDRVSDFAQTTKVFGDIDRRSGEYLNIINDPEIGISGYAENNPVQRMFVKGSDKKYPYLYSRFGNTPLDDNAIFAGNQMDKYNRSKGTDDMDFVQYDDNGNLVTYQSGVDQNTLRGQNYRKNLSLAGRTWQGKMDKETLSRAEADAKLSSFTFDTLSESMRSGNIAAADEAIALANAQYSPGKNNLFQSKNYAFMGEQFLGPVGNATSHLNKNINFDQIIRGTKRGIHIAKYMPDQSGYIDAYGTVNKEPVIDSQVKYEHRRMLGGVNTLHNIAKRVQTEKNQADKKAYDIDKDYKYQFEKIGKKIKNMDFSLPKVDSNSYFGFDSKSGGFNIKLNIKDSKSGK